jgi:hypothetical protein
MAELLTGRVLFQNDSVQTMLARMIGVIGDFPEYMMTEGRDVSKYFNSKGVVFERSEDGESFVYVLPMCPSGGHRVVCMPITPFPLRQVHRCLYGCELCDGWSG